MQREFLAKVPAVREISVAGATVHLVVEGPTDELFRVAAPFGVEQVVTHEPDLEDVFLSYYEHEGDRHGQRAAADQSYDGPPGRAEPSFALR